jgi:hypothetical protein
MSTEIVERAHWFPDALPVRRKVRIAMFCTLGHKKEVKNFAYSLCRVCRNDYAIHLYLMVPPGLHSKSSQLCEDVKISILKKGMEALTERGGTTPSLEVSVTPLNCEAHSAAAPWGSAEYKSIVLWKNMAIIHFLTFGASEGSYGAAFYADDDIHFFRDPWDAVMEETGWGDSAAPGFMAIQGKTIKKDPHALCTGFMAFRPTPEAWDWCRSLFARCEKMRDKEVDDENRMNILQQKEGLVAKELVVRLPVSRFCHGWPLFTGGSDYDEEEWKRIQAEAVLLHNTYVCGIANKRKRFAKLGLWFAGSLAGVTPQPKKPSKQK